MISLYVFKITNVILILSVTGLDFISGHGPVILILSVTDDFPFICPYTVPPPPFTNLYN